MIYFFYYFILWSSNTISLNDDIPHKLSVFGPRSGLNKDQNSFVVSLNVPYFVIHKHFSGAPARAKSMRAEHHSYSDCKPIKPSKFGRHVRPSAYVHPYAIFHMNNGDLLSNIFGQFLSLFCLTQAISSAGTLTFPTSSFHVLLETRSVLFSCDKKYHRMSKSTLRNKFSVKDGYQVKHWED